MNLADMILNQNGGAIVEQLAGQLASSGSGGTDLPSSFLDSDRDGSVADDLLGLAKEFF